MRRFILILILLLFAGCRGDSRIAEYENQLDNVRVTILDPNFCDVSRYIRYEIAAFDKTHGPFDLMLLDCNFDFQKEDFGLLSDDNFSFFYEKVNRFCQKERLCCVVDFNKKIILQDNFPKKIIARWEETNQRGR